MLAVVHLLLLEGNGYCSFLRKSNGHSLSLDRLKYHFPPVYIDKTGENTSSFECESGICPEVSAEERS